MPLTVPEPTMPTDEEATILDRARDEGGFEPRIEADQVVASRLMSSGLLRVQGSYVRGKPVNKVYTTFLGAWALAGWAGRKERVK